MKKKILSIVLVLMLAIVPMIVSGCGPKDEGGNTIRFWGYGDATAKEAYTAMVNAYNAGQGKTDGVTVSFSSKPESGYISLIEQSATSKTGPDVYFAWDRLFKKWTAADMTVNLTDYVNADIEAGNVDLTKIWDSTVSRFRYNKELNMSGEDEAIYGLPIDTSPTALFYNKTALADRGVTVISVATEDMEAWNKNEIADNYGKKKSDFPELSSINVPAKGFFRDDAYTRFEGETWREPSAGTVMVFNDQIAMNWDEIEDIGFLMTNSKNSSKKPTTDYGYYTEWWFNYGWSVGGDCLNDLTGSGEWNFSLLDPNPNYVVMDGTFTGRTGTVYNEGETISFIDKMNILSVDGKDEVLVPDDYGDYYHADESLGKAGIWEGIQAGLDAGVLSQLPSTRDAFSRYLKLGAKSNAVIDGENGLDISPNPSTFSARTSMNYFFSGNLAILAQSSVYMADLSEEAKARGFSWDVAPLVVYKEYEDPSDPDCDTVKAQGKQAGHSNSLSMVVRTGSEKKDDAVRFMMWMASEEGQRIRASIGFFPNQKSLLPEVEFKKGVAPGNVRVFSEALEFQGPGDWWYMPDHVWVEKWCVDLNAEVRNGLMTYEEWYSPAIKRTNEWLQQYKKYSR